MINVKMPYDEWEYNLCNHKKEILNCFNIEGTIADLDDAQKTSICDTLDDIIYSDRTTYSILLLYYDRKFTLREIRDLLTDTSKRKSSAILPVAEVAEMIDDAVDTLCYRLNREQNDQITAKPINTLNLSTHASKVLESAHIHTIRDLIQCYTYANFCALKGMGKRSIEEILTALEHVDPSAQIIKDWKWDLARLEIARKEKDDAMNQSERIVSAAIRFTITPTKQRFTFANQPLQYIYVTGKSHSGCLDLIDQFGDLALNRDTNKDVLGFMTSCGRFVDSELALDIAKQANQLKSEAIHSITRLFSEDIIY